MEMAALPRIVTALNGSSRLRKASRAFSSGVSGLTWGPLMKRAKKLMIGGGEQGGSWVPVAGGAVLAVACGEASAGGMKPARVVAIAVAEDASAAPVDSLFGTTRQGPALELTCLTICGCGASGSGAAGSECSTWPAHAAGARSKTGERRRSWRSRVERMR